MLELTTFGTVDVRHEGERLQPLLKRPKRLAILAYLASLPGNRSVRRDTLLAMFWPELDTRRARRALRQSLFELRRTLPDDLLVGDSEHVTVPAGRARCDAREFQALLDAGEDAAAAKVYRGPFLDGFHLKGAPEFERWVGERRTGFARAAAAAAWRAASAATVAGHEAAAVDLSRHALTIEPFDERGWQRLIRLLDSIGDPAGAVAAFEEMTARLREGLDLEPSAETRALIEDIRCRSRPAAAGDPGAGVPDGGGASIRSLAVLPFRDLSAARDRAYFASGVTEMVIMELARTSGLGVISHTSVLQYASSNTPVARIAAQLDVDAVVEGTVQREGDRVRVTAQLVRSRPERHLWAGSFERQIRDVLALQAEVARAIAAEIDVALAPRGTESPPYSPEPPAHEAYLRGRYYWSRWTTQGFARALEEYETAIRLDPGYALPRAGLGSALSVLGYFGVLRPRDAFPRSTAAAEAAIQRDSTVAEAWTALGMARLLFAYDPAAARELLEHATALSPASADAHHALALLHSAAGRSTDALAAAETARRLDPVSLPVLNAGGWIQLAAGDLTAAMRTAERMRELDTAFAPAWWLEGVVSEMRREYGAAVAVLERGAELAPRNPFISASLAHALALDGRTDSARGILETLIAADAPATAVAWVHEGLDDPHGTLTWLQAGLERREGWLAFLDAWPRFERVRARPEFDSLRREAGLR